MKEEKKPACSVCLLSWMDQVAETYTRHHSFSTADNYLRTRRSLHSWLSGRGSQDLPLRRLNAELVADYQEFLTVAGHGRNTRTFHLRNFRSAYNKAVDAGLLPRSAQNGHPFEHTSTTSLPTHRRASEAEVVARLEKLDIASALVAMGKKSTRKSFAKTVSDLSYARDIFIFCFYACGMPFVDFAHLTPDNIRHGLLCYGRHKTGTYIEMEILPPMQRIIDRYAVRGHYLFPVLTAVSTKEAYVEYTKAIRKYNHRLAQLSQMLDIGMSLSTYVPRHTWATTVYHRGMPESCIKERLGHVSLNTTRSYLKTFESSQIDEINKKIMASIFE